jgi:long-subunit acyl-CoA synthetase (AMP-forming)
MYKTLENVITQLVSTLKKFRDRNAFCINETFYTYAELAKHISKIRRTLQALNPESKNIGLVANDDIETYASIYALWLEGLAYVPQHPLQPVQRNQEIIEQAEIKTVLSSNTVSFPRVKMVKTNSLIFEDYLLEPKETDDSALACILFTSGSTGVPKGVTITYGNIVALVHSFWAAGYIVDEFDKFLQPFDLTFVLYIVLLEMVIINFIMV